jgi:hypothetical protein
MQEMHFVAASKTVSNTSLRSKQKSANSQANCPIYATEPTFEGRTPKNYYKY